MDKLSEDSFRLLEGVVNQLLTDPAAALLSRRDGFATVSFGPDGLIYSYGLSSGRRSVKCHQSEDLVRALGSFDPLREIVVVVRHPEYRGVVIWQK